LIVAFFKPSIVDAVMSGEFIHGDQECICFVHHFYEISAVNEVLQILWFQP
jgi:hypothetical protein